MKEKKLKELLNELEGPKLEHKGKEFLSKSPKEVAKQISSFINAEGGNILVGVKENKPDGLVVTQKDEERLSQICRDNIHPTQNINFEICEIKKQIVLNIDITPSREPVEVNGRHYKRVGSTTRIMTHEELKKKFSEAKKIYKIISKKDAEDIINQRQIYRDVILDKNQKKKQYLTFDSSSGPILGSSCIIYNKLYETFDKKSKLIFTTLHNVTIEELTKILAKYYQIFGDFSYDTSAFSIEQSGFNWIGYGPKDFIKTLVEQKERYKSIHKKYGEDVHIHHRESAFFIDEIKDGLFFISCEPNYKKYTDNMTIDYFDVGFVTKRAPFSRLFNDFFQNIHFEPITLFSNDDKFNLSKKYDLHVKTIEFEVREEITFQADGLIQAIKQSTKDDHVWISGAYGKTPNQLGKLELHDNIAVHLRQHHWFEDKVVYHIDRIKYTKFDLGCFPAAIVSIDIDW